MALPHITCHLVPLGRNVRTHRLAPRSVRLERCAFGGAPCVWSAVRMERRAYGAPCVWSVWSAVRLEERRAYGAFGALCVWRSAVRMERMERCKLQHFEA
ncbi:uncharacterized [Tachysurus ichikawai]